MVCDIIMLTFALLWLWVANYKDNIDNAKELFKSSFVDKATCSFSPPEFDAMPNMPPDDNDNDDV
jgi:hypothetical protein